MKPSNEDLATNAHAIDRRHFLEGPSLSAAALAAPRVPADPYRTPVFRRETEHRRRTARRTIPNV